MTSLEHCVCQQVKNLVLGLNQKKQFKAVSNELFKIAMTFGQPAEKYLFSVLIQGLDCKDSRVISGSKDSLKAQFLMQAISTFSLKSSFIDYFSQVFPTGDIDEYFEDFSKTLKLSLSVQLVLALSLSFSSTPHVSRAGLAILRTKVREYAATGKPQSMPSYALHAILSVLRTNPDFMSDPNAKDWTNFLMMSNASNDPLLLPPLTEADLNYQGENNWKSIDISLVEVLEDLGPYCSQSPETLRDVFSNFPRVDAPAMAEVFSLFCERYSEAVDFEARVLSATFTTIPEERWRVLTQENVDRRTQTAWNLDNLSRALAESYRLDWQAVIAHLDIPRFVIKDDQAFQMLTTLYYRITGESFPVAPFLKRWKHPRGQVSFLLHSVYSKVAPQIFSYTGCKPRVEIEFAVSPELKSVIDALTTLDVLKMLVELSVTEFYTMIRNFLLSESERLSGILIQGLAKIHPTQGQHLWNELTALIMPKIIANQANPVMLHHIWNDRQELVIQGAIDYYEQEPTTLRLSCLMELSQEIKNSLMELACCKNYKFSVHFGLLASKKDYLHLEHWLTERIKVAKDAFVTCLLDYLHERVVTPTADSVETRLEKAYVSKEGLRIVFDRLMNTEFERDLSQAVQRRSADLFGTLRELLPDLQDSSRTTDEIDAAANHYFQQLYSGETNVHDFIRLMHRLKNSTNSNENKIFDSMIKNLLDEYGFFHKYPEKELTITAELYGSIIRYGDINPIHLFCAMKHVRESLLKQNTKLFKFGFRALELFKDVIHTWPNYCSDLANLPSLQTGYPELVKFLQNAGRRTKEKEPEPPPQRQPSPPPPQRPPPQEEPEPVIPPATKDNLMFILNTISKQNLAKKIEELREVLIKNLEANVAWFANYLVWKRASNEPNFHSLYISMIKELDSKVIYKAILRETYKYIDSLIGRRIELSDDQRKSLNALGSWLGKLTVSRDKPILIQCLDLKQELRDAFEQQRLIAIVPFVCKILKTCKKSQVFTKQNRWVLAVASLLNEIKQRTDKARIVSEIEILFKKLSISPADCAPSNLLEQRPPPEPVQKVQRSESINLCEQTMMAQLPSLVTISSRFLEQYPEHELRNIVAVAIEKAIKEIIQPIVQRNVNIALITTKELVLKDFELEKDPSKLQQAAELVVKSLAGSLAKVTSREPFRVHVCNFLNESLRAKSLSGGSIKEIAEEASRDNLDLGCDLIAKIVVKKALNDVAHEESIKHEIMKRQDSSFLSELSAKRALNPSVPESLRPKLSGLSAEQFAVYLNFDRVKEDIRPEPPREARQPTSRFEEELDAAERLSASKPHLDNPEVQHAMENVTRLAVSSKPDILTACITIIFRRLYANQRQRSFYLQLLQSIKTQHQGIVTETTNYFLLLDESQRYAWPLTVDLIRNDIISLGDFDAALGKGIEQDRALAIEFAIKLLREYVINASTVSPTELRATIAAIKRLRERSPSEELISLCLKLSSPAKAPMIAEKGKTLESIELRFNDWLAMTLGSTPISIDKIPEFVKSLDNTGFFATPEKSDFFFRTLAECALSRTAGSDYSAIDSFCKLCQVIIVLRYPAEKLQMMNIVLGSIKKLILSSDHTPSFNQRGFYRILQGLLTESSQPQISFQDSTIVYEFLLPIADTFHALNPCRLPSFCFAWLELVGHRFFLPKMLRSAAHAATHPSEHWRKLNRLMVDLFRFINVYYWEPPLTESLRKFYEGVLRLLLVLMHDCPEFLYQYHLDFVELIPDSCLQLRNLILSAYPKDMQVPLPHTPNLKVDQLPGMHQPPEHLSDFRGKLEHLSVRGDVDTYFDTRENRLIEKICNKLMVPTPKNAYEASTLSNNSLMNALVVYVAFKVHNQQVEVSQSNAFFLSIVLMLSDEPRLQLINAIVNQLRYPNTDMKFASFLILSLFSECSQPTTEEMIAKVLTERALTYRPHPWGVLITLIELVKNPKYEFLKKAFTRSTPDIEKLYLKLSRNCMPETEDPRV